MGKGKVGRDKAVKDQYEDFPYPPRNPVDEKSRLITGSPSHLSELNHYIYAGARDFSRPFRALVAGGGTGDAVIMMAQQLADRCPLGSVTYLDLSKASRTVVEARASVRGLNNIEFHTGSILDLPDMGLEPFDYIDCCGVLHHLENPGEGLNALAAVLKEDGGLGLMLYATLGRTGVYHIQNALKMLVAGEPMSTQVQLGKKLVKDLPATNWLVRNNFVGDHKMGEDAAFFDLLLHPRDRSYLVPEVVELLENSDLDLVTFLEPAKYDPALFLSDKDIVARLKGMSLIDKAALAENVTGSLKIHIFYAKKKGQMENAVAKVSPKMVPVLKDGNPPDLLAKAFQKKKDFPISFDGVSVTFPVPDRLPEVVSFMDGNRTLSDIQKEMSLNWETFRRLFSPIYKFLNSLNLLWLRES